MQLSVLTLFAEVALVASVLGDVVVVVVVVVACVVVVVIVEITKIIQGKE